MINVNNKSTMLYSDLQIGDLLILQNTGFVVEAIDLSHVTTLGMYEACRLFARHYTTKVKYWKDRQSREAGTS